MNLNELREVLGAKIYWEYEAYKQKTLRKSPEEIYGSAYQIDAYINLYETLLEMSQELGEEDIKFILLLPDVLTFLFEEWLAFEDSHVKDLYEFLRNEIAKNKVENKMEAA